MFLKITAFFTLALSTIAFAEPVDITIVDVAGNLAYTREIFDNYAKANPQKVKQIFFERGSATAVPSKLEAQKQAKKNEIHLVLGGFDIMAAGADKGLWLQLVPQHQAALPNFQATLQPGALKAQQLSKGFGVVNVYSPSGPVVAYNPKTVKNPPQTVFELKEWIKQNPKRFFYARPANSGPGRAFLMGLPYLLKDKNPADPEKGWDKTWDFLKEIDKSIEYYPPGTTAQMKEFGQGGKDMTITTAGWDLQMRSLGTIPPEFKVQILKDTTWVSDAHFMLVPATIDEARLKIILDMMSYTLKPEQQSLTVATGGMYPGPVVKNVNFKAAPERLRQPLEKFLRPEVDSAIGKDKIASSLPPDKMLKAFERWEKDIGSRVR